MNNRFLSGWIIFFNLLIIVQAWPQGGWRIAADAPSTSRFDDIYFTNDSVAFIGQKGIIYRSEDRGERWSQIGSLPNNAYIRSIEFINDSIGFIGSIYDAVGGAGFYKTVNAGITWTRIDNQVSGGMFGICGLDHMGSTIIGVGIYSEPAKFYFSKDAGQTWTSKSIPQAAALVDCQMLNDSTYLIAGNSNPLRNASIYKTIDYGKTWTDVAKSDAPASYCWKLNVNSNGLGIGSIEDGKTTFITHDYGDSWQEVFVVENAAESLPLGGAAFLNDSIGWAGDQWNAGLWETKNGGNSWQYVEFGSSINKIKILDSNTAIAVGKSVYIYNLETIATSKIVEKTNFHTMNINPNPASNEINISVDLIQNTAMRLDLMDENGTLIRELYRASTPVGGWKHSFKIGDLKSGIYYVWMRTNEGHLVKRVSVLAK